MMENGMRLEDRAAIQDAIYRWCRAIDRLDFDAFSSCFHDDAYDDHIFYRGNISGFVDCLRQRHAEITSSIHAVSNILIEFIGGDVALVETYVRVMQRRPFTPAPGAPEPDHNSHVSEVYCRYVDRFERRQGAWKIAHRTLVTDTAVEYTDREPEHRLPAAGSANRGRRDLQDTIYQRQAELRASLP
jgi:hypothetical protein